MRVRISFDGESEHAEVVNIVGGESLDLVFTMDGVDAHVALLEFLDEEDTPINGPQDFVRQLLK